MIKVKIKIGLALLMLFSIMGTAYAADNSNEVSKNAMPVPSGFHRLSDVSFFNNNKEISTFAADKNLFKDVRKNIKIPSVPQNLIDVNLLNNNKAIAKSPEDQILVPESLINSVKYLRQNIIEFPQNITANLTPILTSNKAQETQQQKQLISIQSLGDVLFTGGVNTLWKESIDGNQILNSMLIPDLDGDGLKDMISIIYDKDPYTGECQYTLVAQKGSNGSHLWSHSISGSYAQLQLSELVDLDGDGLNDVLVNTQKYDTPTNTYTYSLIAKKGSNGATLWSKSISGSSVYLSGYTVGDLNGDGLNDVLVNTQKYDSPTNSYSSTLIAKIGSNGANLWSHSISGSSVYLSGYPAGDLNGDGLNDVLVNTQKYDSPTNSYISTLIAKIGSNGANLWSQTITGSSAYIFGYSAGDLNGDGLNDVLVNTQKYDAAIDTSTSSLIAKKGSNGVNLWSHTISGSSVYIYGNTAGDLNGDTLNDVLVNTQKYDPTTATSTSSLIAKKGSNGATLWSQTISGSSVYIYGQTTGDLNGDTLNDVLVNTQKYDSPTNSYKSSLIAKKGSNGATLWSQTINGSSAYISGYPAGDLNGDGYNDILVNTQKYDSPTNTYTYSLIVKKGSNGATLWSQTISGSSSNIYGNIVDDLNGDGLKDVLVRTQKYDISTNTYTSSLIARKGSNGVTLWSQTIIGSSAYIYGSIVGDLNGDGLEDVFVLTQKYNPTTASYTSSLIARKGSNGETLWSQMISGSNAYISGNIVGDLNGDGLEDVLVLTQKYNPTTNTYTYSLIARKGSNGETLWSQTISGSNAYISGYIVGDLNGDGLKDALVNAVTSNATAGTYASSLTAKKGKDGTQLWKATANTQMWISLNYYGGDYTDDLNGDGIDEVLFGTFRKIYVVKDI